MNKLAAKMAKVRCDELLLTHSANSIKPTFCSIVVEYFDEAVLRHIACCAQGQLPSPCLPVTPLLTIVCVWGRSGCGRRGGRRQSRIEYITKMVDFNCVMVRAVFDGGLGVDPPAKISDPPAAIKKRKGGSTFYLPMH